MSTVLIVGAGASGLAASKCLTDLNIRSRVVDRYGRPGGAYLRMYPKTKLSSPTRYLSLPGAAPPRSDDYLEAREYALYLQDYALRNGIEPVEREVIEIRRGESSFTVTFSDTEEPERYRAVIVCTGSFDSPYVPVIAGLTDTNEHSGEAIRYHHASHWHGPESVIGKRLLIVGDRITAVELAEECVRAGLRPILSVKRPVRLYPLHVLGVNPRLLIYPFLRYLPLRFFPRQCNRGWRYRGINRGFKEYARRRLLDVRPSVSHVQGHRVTFADGSGAEIDVAIFATGYRHDMPFIPSSIPRGVQGVPRVRNGESVVWPGLFVLGVPCAFSGNSHFIFGIAADAQLVARAVRQHLNS